MASDVPNRFDGDDLSVELDFVALHDFLDCLTDVIHPGIDAGFLREYLALYSPCRVHSSTLSPVLVAALTAVSRLSNAGLKATVKALSTILPLTWTPKSTFRTSSYWRMTSLAPGLGVQWAATLFKQSPVGNPMPALRASPVSRPWWLVSARTPSSISWASWLIEIPGFAIVCTYWRTWRWISAALR